MASRGIPSGASAEGAVHESFLRHKGFRWLKVSLLVSLLVLAGYALIDAEPRHNGGSAYGYFLGSAGALLILWLTALGVRKRAMTDGRWSLKGWTSAHVYLGLSLVVIATLHTGFQFGWNVHTLAYGLMMAVVLSGLYGIVAYARLPAELSNSRSDMTRSQMISAIISLNNQIATAAQPISDADTEVVTIAIADKPFRGGLLRRLRGKYPRCRTAWALAEIARRRDQEIGDEAAALETVRALLERKANALDRMRRHMRIKALLEIWLYVHVPLTFALIAALTAHIVSVFFYW
jgi:hypothetical protein